MIFNFNNELNYISLWVYMQAQKWTRFERDVINSSGVIWFGSWVSDKFFDFYFGRELIRLRKCGQVNNGLFAYRKRRIIWETFIENRRNFSIVIWSYRD